MLPIRRRAEQSGEVLAERRRDLESHLPRVVAGGGTRWRQLLSFQQMNVVVRSQKWGDGEGIARAWRDTGEFYAALAPEHFQVPEDAGLAESFDATVASKDELRIVAELDAVFVGWLVARFETREADASKEFVRDHGKDRVAVDALLVHRDAWRHGVGSGLLDAAEEWGRERGATVIRLDTYSRSPVSVPFYRRHGYSERSVVFTKDL
jgi:GNAT superfamily N-acetyltransferase